MPPGAPQGACRRPPGGPQRSPEKAHIKQCCFLLVFTCLFICFLLFVYICLHGLHFCYFFVTFFLILLAGLAGRPPEEAHGRPPEAAPRGGPWPPHPGASAHNAAHMMHISLRFSAIPSAAPQPLQKILRERGLGVPQGALKGRGW